MSTPTRPGWYDDPQDAAQLRYFDGVVWTSHTTPRSTRPSSAAAQPGQQAYPGQGHAPQYLGQVQAQSPQQGAGYAAPPPSAPGSPPAGTGAGGSQAPGQHQPSQHQQQFPGAPQQGGWNQPAYYGVPHQPSTPDGQPLASYGRRVGAYLIDGLIQLVIVMVLAGWLYVRALGPLFDEFSRALEAGSSMPTLSLADVDWAALVGFVVVAAAIQFGYQVFFLSRFGATPGKLAVGISVRLRDRPGRLSTGEALRRVALPAALFVAQILPVLGVLALLARVLDLLWPSWDPQKQALHDKVGRTNVVVGRAPRR
jgi:uncharacterized RDD family membrane protein YckC